MLFGAAIVIALVRNRRDDRRLIVVPAMRCDAGLLADLRMGAVGADQQTGGNRFPSASATSIALPDIFKAGHRTRAQIDAELLCLCHQRIDQMPVLDHVSEWFALLHLAAEGQECRTHRIVEL